jgi:hypothetical protein
VTTSRGIFSANEWHYVKETVELQKACVDRSKTGREHDKTGEIYETRIEEKRG